MKSIIKVSGLFLSVLILSNLGLAGWQSLGGPDGGDVYNLFTISDGSIYASSVNSGLFKSTDNGITWNTTCYKSPGGLYLNITESSTGRLFMTNFTGSVYWSDDGFESADEMAMPDNVLIVELVYAIDNSTVILIGRNPNLAVFKTSDFGENWTESAQLGFNNVLPVIENDSGTLFIPVSLTGPLFRSEDAGDTWNLIEAADPAGLSFMKITENGTLIGAYYGNLYRSTDNGDNWTMTHEGVITNGIQAMSIAEDGTIYAVSMEPRILFSEDDGQNWNETIPDLPAIYDSHCLTVAAEERLLLGVFDRAVLASEDFGATWTPSNTGLTAFNITGLAVNSVGTVYAAAENNGIYQLQPDGGQWTLMDFNYTGSDLDVIRGADGTLYAGSTDYFYRSDDDGANWTEYDTGINSSNEVRFAVGLNGDVFVTNAQNGIHQSEDSGETWIHHATALVPSAVTFDNQEGIYYAGLTGFFRSTDNGSTWTSVMAGAHSDCCADLQNGIVYLDNDASLNAVCKSTDNGTTWTPIGANILEPGTMAMLTTHKLGLDESENLYADLTVNYFLEGRSERKIYISPDQGENWSEDSNGLIFSDVYSFASRNNGDFYLGSNGLIYIYGETSVKADNPALVESYHLSQNIPNPFNPNTMISFTVPRKSFVTLSVFNLIGQRVAILAEGYYGAGKHSFQFQAENLSSGTYFYQLNSDQGRISRQMLLIK